jgi:hypothetical protein
MEDKKMNQVPNSTKSIAEVAQQLGVTPDTIRSWIHNRKVDVGPNNVERDAFAPRDVRTLASHQLRIDVRSLFNDADEWLDAPNVEFGGFSPRELIGTDKEEMVRNFIESRKHGMPS